MARTPNYRFERSERERLLAERKAKMELRRAEKRGDSNEPTGEPSGEPANNQATGKE